MKLDKILGCVGLNGEDLLGLTLTLVTTQVDPPVYLELQSIGYRFGSRCQEVEIEDD